tara:strand:+ start:3237 stop:5285 length:2049 start_codon:yes stop_codon:yes gene_type:complete
MAQKNLSVKLSLNDKQFQSSLKKATGKVKKFGQSMKNTGKTLSRNLTLPLVAFGAASIAAFDKQQKAIAQVEAGLKSTGNAAGFTSKQLQKMASDLQGKTLFGDEVILKDATSQLLTFTNIAGEQFERTQLAALNLATRLDGDLKSSSIQLGKALNDPIANLSALSRSGIQFSNDQKEVIKTLAESGRLAEAQTIILDELDKQYGGAAEAAAKAGAGGLKQLQNQFGDLMEEIGGMLIPIVIDLGNHLKKFLQGFAKLSPEVKKMIVTVGILAGGIGPLLVVFGSLVGVVTALSIKFIAIAAAVAALALGVLYVNDNWEAFIERFSDINWWKNALLEMIALLIEFNPINLLTKGLNEFLDYLGVAQIPNPFEKGADFFRDMKVDIEEYENDFQDFGTFIDNQGKKIKKALKGIGGALNVGGGSSGSKSDSPNLPTISKKGTGGGMPTMKLIDEPSVKKSTKTIRMHISELEADLQGFVDKFGASLTKTFNDISQVIGEVSNLFSQIHQKKMIELDNEKAKELEKIESSKMSDEQKEAAVNDLNDKFAKKKAAADKKQAKRAKTIAILEAKVATAAAVVKALPNVPLSVAVGVIGAAKIATIASTQIPAFADGGLVSGATLGLVGEGPGTSMSNPEVIAPLDKLQSMIGQGQGSVEVFGRISGSDILISSDRARKNRNRTRGY